MRFSTFLTASALSFGGALGKQPSSQSTTVRGPANPAGLSNNAQVQYATTYNPNKYNQGAGSVHQVAARGSPVISISRTHSQKPAAGQAANSFSMQDAAVIAGSAAAGAALMYGVPKGIAAVKKHANHYQVGRAQYEAQAREQLAMQAKQGMLRAVQDTPQEPPAGAPNRQRRPRASARRPSSATIPTVTPSTPQSGGPPPALNITIHNNPHMSNRNVNRLQRHSVAEGGKRGRQSGSDYDSSDCDTDWSGPWHRPSESRQASRAPASRMIEYPGV